MFTTSFGTEVMSSAFGNHSLDQIQRRRDGRREVAITDTHQIVRDTARATNDYLVSAQHAASSSKARLRFKCPFVRGKYTSDFLQKYQVAFLHAFHKNYNHFLPRSYELEEFL
jgi:hypothetical protein